MYSPEILDAARSFLEVSKSLGNLEPDNLFKKLPSRPDLFPTDVDEDFFDKNRNQILMALLQMYRGELKENKTNKMENEFKRMQELAGVSLNEQMGADVEKWLDGYLKGTVLTSKDDIEKYGSLDDPKKVKYVVDGGFKDGMLDVKYSYNKEFIHIPQKDIQDLAKKMGVKDSNYYQVEDAVKDALKKKGLKQKLDFTFPKVGEMQSQFFRNPNQKQTNESESLNEHYVAGGIVGVGAINQIPPREKSDYEMAFEHFMTEGKEEVEEESHNMARPGTEREAEKEEMDEGYYEEDDTMEEAVGIPAEASAIRDAVRKMMKDNPNDADLGAAVRKKFAK